MKMSENSTLPLIHRKARGRLALYAVCDRLMRREKKEAATNFEDERVLCV